MPNVETIANRLSALEIQMAIIVKELPALSEAVADIVAVKHQFAGGVTLLKWVGFSGLVTILLIAAKYLVK